LNNIHVIVSQFYLFLHWGQQWKMTMQSSKSTSPSACQPTLLSIYANNYVIIKDGSLA